MTEFQQLPYTERTFDFIAGEILLIDKPKGWTSFDVVNRIRYRLRKITGKKKIKVGHSGTLDPMATGLLLIATGKFTKKLTELTGLPKVYTGTICFGESTPSYDAETEADHNYPTAHITKELLTTLVADNFFGEIDQKPPIFSAIKVAGKRAYKSARAGQAVEIPMRRVLVSQFDLHRFELPEVDFEVACSKGTYIRSLAHDLGEAAGSGAHLCALRRTEIGEFSIETAYDCDAFAEWLDGEIPAEG
ncbi:MAG: tRNA pseudouridine(55) synthase TruB [Saprospiraceae bacterium]